MIGLRAAVDSIVTGAPTRTNMVDLEFVIKDHDTHPYVQIEMTKRSANCGWAAVRLGIKLPDKKDQYVAPLNGPPDSEPEFSKYMAREQRIYELLEKIAEGQPANRAAWLRQVMDLRRHQEDSKLWGRLRAIVSQTPYEDAAMEYTKESSVGRLADGTLINYARFQGDSIFAQHTGGLMVAAVVSQPYDASGNPRTYIYQARAHNLQTLEVGQSKPSAGDLAMPRLDTLADRLLVSPDLSSWTAHSILDIIAMRAGESVRLSTSAANVRAFSSILGRAAANLLPLQ